MHLLLILFLLLLFPIRLFATLRPFKQIHPGQSDEEKFLSSTRVLAQQIFRITKEFPFSAVSEAPLQMHKTDVIYIYSYSASL